MWIERERERVGRFIDGKKTRDRESVSEKENPQKNSKRERETKKMIMIGR